MNIVFMGTPEFSLPSLKILLESKSKILSVVTQPDKERGRGKKLSFTPIKQFAVENSITVYQPEKVKTNEEFVKQVKSLNPDLFVVCNRSVISRASLVLRARRESEYTTSTPRSLHTLSMDA